MTSVIHRVEQSSYDTLPLHDHTHHERKGETDDVVSELSRLLAERVSAKLIVTASLSGETGRVISRYRPELPIVVGTQTSRVFHQLNLSWGVIPFLLEPCASIEELAERAMLYLKDRHLAHDGDKIIIVGGEPVGQAGNINLLEVREVK
jgi:pyruvate kinase